MVADPWPTFQSSIAPPFWENGSGPYRFSTAFDTELRLFETRGAVADCLSTCHFHALCAGVFVFHSRCWGLSSLGRHVPTKARSLSVRKVSWDGVESTYETVAVGPTTYDPHGMRFSTAFDEEHRLFQHTQLFQCHSDCSLDVRCLGIFDWTSKGKCWGLSALGGLVETRTRSQSTRKQVRIGQFQPVFYGSRSGGASSQRFSTA